MSVDWNEFKTCLNDNNVSVAYVDDEGTEIPIQAECEFLEALKFAKTYGNNQLRLILKSQNMTVNDTFAIANKTVERVKPEHVSHSTTKRPKITSSAYLHLDKKGSESVKSLKNQMKEQSCWCSSGIPHLWFIHYIKRFRKKVLEEIRLSVNEAVQRAIKEQTTERSETNTKSNAKALVQPTFGACTNTSDLRNSSHHLIRGEVEEFQKLQEKMRKLKNEKSRLNKNCNHNNKVNNITASVMTKAKSMQHEMEGIKLEYQPSDQLNIKLILRNNGTLPWHGAKLTCSAWGVCLEQCIFHINDVQPGGSRAINLKGRVADKDGLYGIQSFLMEGTYRVGEVIDIGIKVSKKSSPSDGTTNISPAFSVIVDCQKKIEENIGEIEKRLQSINFQQSNKTETESREVFSGGGNDDNVEKVELLTTNEKAYPTGVLVSIRREPHLLDEDDDKAELDSDSDLSVLHVSDEEDNFIVIPTPSNDSDKSDDNTGEDDEKKERDPRKKTNKVEVVQIGVFESVRSACRVPRNEKNLSLEKESQTKETHATTVGSKPRMFAPSVDSVKSEGNKHKLSSYSFTTTDLTNPTLAYNSKEMEKEMLGGDKKKRPRREGGLGRNKCRSATLAYNSKEKLGGERKKRPKREGGLGRNKCHSASDKKRAKNSDCKHKVRTSKIPMSDSKDVVFVVNAKGICTPFAKEKDNRPELKAQTTNGNEQKFLGKAMLHEARATAHEGTSNDSVNILPDTFINGASNVATFAISTAKSVINNLQSVFAENGKTKKPSETVMGDLLKLFDMGFEDMERNLALLSKYGNDLSKVLDELISQQQQKQK